MSISLEDVTFVRRVSGKSVYGRFARRLSIERVTDRLARRLATKSVRLRLVRWSGECERDDERACDLSKRWASEILHVSDREARFSLDTGISTC